MKYISCEGYESRWDYCAYEDWATALCSHHEDVGVSCTDIGGKPMEMSAAGVGIRSLFKCS